MKRDLFANHSIALQPHAPLRQGELQQGRLRVAFVTETYPPEVNGVALTVARVVSGLRARGHEMQLVRPRQETDGARGGADARELLVSGLPIPRYPHLKMGLPAGRLLARVWTANRPDVVHVATEGPLGYSAANAARRLGIAVTSDFRTNFHAYTRHYGIGWLARPILGYLRAFHNHTATTMVPTEALRCQLTMEGFDNLVVVGRGVDAGRFDPSHRSEELRRTWGAGPEQPVALYVGRLASEKNLGLLVRSFHAISLAQPAARLVLVGDGPMRESLRSALPEAVFAGQRHGADLAAHYASADLFVFPSLTETFGNVTPEAMASGLAVVAYDHAAAAQLIRPGQSGVLVACGNEAQFVRSAVALANSRALRESMGAQARLHVSHHGWDAVLGRFESVLRHALQRQTHAQPTSAARMQMPAP